MANSTDVTAAVTAARATEFGDLLRSRRQRLRPADVGLPAGSRRRAAGLRREEVAGLAGISTIYYTFLEQGRELRPSSQVVDALADALRLTPAERSHLHTLGHGRSDAPAAAELVSPDVVALVLRLDPCPTYVTGRRWDVLAANRAARALWTDWPALPVGDRNMLCWMFTDPGARITLVEWEKEAIALLGRYRASAARHPGDPEFAALTGRLRAASPEFRDWWPRHDISPLSSGTKLVHHPALGTMELRHTVLRLADDPEQKLVTFAPSDADQAGIARLISG
jgi:transcriptional regulator with XRE-family HTH domain